MKGVALLARNKGESYDQIDRFYRIRDSLHNFSTSNAGRSYS